MLSALNCAPSGQCLFGKYFSASYTIQAQTNFPRTRVHPYMISGGGAAAVLT